MQTVNKYSDIEITNSEIMKFSYTSSFYRTISVIMAKTEKRLLKFIETKMSERYFRKSEELKKEESEIFRERVNPSKETNIEELNKREEVLQNFKRREKEFSDIVSTITGELRLQEQTSEKIIDKGIRIEENQYQKSRTILTESINEFINEKEKVYQLIKENLIKLKEFEQIEEEKINIDEIIEELNLTLKLVQKIQGYIGEL